jgi:hypothetical protein
MSMHTHRAADCNGCATCGARDVALAAYRSLATAGRSASRVCQGCYARLRRWEKDRDRRGGKTDGDFGPGLCGRCARAVLAETGALPAG